MEVDSAQLMTALEVTWWLVFFGTFGLCAGSFLNAMIYRIPRNISLSEPLWSFCPICEARIHWYDNLPLISFVRLRGRCRYCGASISPRYPTVEILGALLVLLVFDAFFIAQTHVGVGINVPGVTWQLSEDWPVFIAHVILFCALLAMSAIDIEHYWVDVRFSSLAVGAGFVLHALWTPNRPRDWHRPADTTAVASLVAAATLLATILVLRRFRSPDHERSAEPLAPTEDTGQCDVQPVDEQVTMPPSMDPDEADSPCEATENADALPLPDHAPPTPIMHGLGYLAALAAGVSLVALVYGGWAEATGIGGGLTAPSRWAPGVVLLFVLIVASGAPRRESDGAIIEAIEAERTTARRRAGIEFLELLPAIVVGGLTLYYGISYADSAARFTQALDWEPLPDWRPLEGLGTAAAGFIIGGGIGWLVRLVATLVMGKEAFGTGDIHIMAAAGAVAGWPVVLIGFVLCSGLALLGWALALPFKRSRAIPLGPWLSISFLIVVLLYDPIISSPVIQNVIYVFTSSAVTFGNFTATP